MQPFSVVVVVWYIEVSVVGRTNKDNQHWAQLVLGWVTVSRLENHLGV